MKMTKIANNDVSKNPPWWVPGEGITLWWTSILSRGELKYSCWLSATEIGISAYCMDHSARCRVYLHLERIGQGIRSVYENHQMLDYGCSQDILKELDSIWHFLFFFWYSQLVGISRLMQLTSVTLSSIASNNNANKNFESGLILKHVAAKENRNVTTWCHLFAVNIACVFRRHWQFRAFSLV